jgi:hypothetical protein
LLSVLSLSWSLNLDAYVTQAGVNPGIAGGALGADGKVVAVLVQRSSSESAGVCRISAWMSITRVPPPL